MKTKGSFRWSLVLPVLCASLAGCGKVQTTSHLESADKPESDSDPVDFNIVGGESSVMRPFFASLRSDNSPAGQWCGGAFISDKKTMNTIIVSAAHCFDGMMVENLHVAVGETRNITNHFTKRRAKIERILIHPDYDPVNQKNDIALLVVSPSERSKLGALSTIARNKDSTSPESLRKSLKFSSNI